MGTTWGLCADTNILLAILHFLKADLARIDIFQRRLCRANVTLFQLITSRKERWSHWHFEKCIGDGDFRAFASHEHPDADEQFSNPTGKYRWVQKSHRDISVEHKALVQDLLDFNLQLALISHVWRISAHRGFKAGGKALSRSSCGTRGIKWAWSSRDA